MYSIGQLSRRTGVKVPTIRYYEQTGLMPLADRTSGNQRRYDADGLERLSFIRHARGLGFPIEAISALIELQTHPDRSCQAAGDLAQAQLDDVRNRIARLQALESELDRIVAGCDGKGAAGDCHVMTALADHDLCAQDH